MDGRSVVMANDRTPVASGLDVKEQLQDDTATDEEEDGERDEDEDGEADSDMVLSKDDFLMLQAFHRFVPLPALRSRIVRLLCEDDIQVADEEDGDLPESSSSTRRSTVRDDTTATAPPAQLVSGLKAVRTLSRTSLVAQSPLTRRLSTTKSPSQTMLKPHRQVNLAAQTPRIKRTSASIDTDERTG